MKHYAVAEIEVTDPSWVEDYIENVTPMVALYGGKYLSRSRNAERLEGDRDLPHVYVVIEWPDRASAERFYQSDAYAPYLASRQAGSRGQFVLVPGEDMASAG